jgi:quercetin dioxygenase-like cupin family protein
MNRALLCLAALSVLKVPSAVQAASCGAQKPDARDAVAVSPQTHKVLLENDRVRVIDVNLPAGAKEPQHSHAWPALIIEDTPRAGAVPEVRNFKTRWEGPQVRAHAGKVPVHYLRIEDKRADCEPSKDLSLPPTDGVVIRDPSIKVPFENAYVRVLEIEVNPGESEPPHTHTWPSVVYYYRLPPSTRGTTDGAPPSIRPELKQMQVTFDTTAQPVHTLLNRGTYLYQAHRIEMKPVTDAAAGKR